MSMAPSFIYCRDGKTYKDLVYRDRDGNWFICFDYSEPVEIVIKLGSGVDPKKVLQDLGIPYIRLLRPVRQLRHFDKDILKLSLASCRFLHVKNEPFPTPRDWDEWEAVYDKVPTKEGCYYGVTP